MAGPICKATFCLSKKMQDTLSLNCHAQLMLNLQKVEGVQQNSPQTDMQQSSGCIVFAVETKHHVTYWLVP